MLALPVSEKAQEELDAWGFTSEEQEGVMKRAVAGADRKGQKRIDLYVMRDACEQESAAQLDCV